MHNCEICKRGFETIGGLHNHLSRGEKTTQEKYYHKFFPRFDINNGKILPFKNYKDYFSRNFVDKRSEFSYIMSEGFSEEVRDILVEQLDTITKKRERFPTYCEWRSSKNIRYDWLDKIGVLPKLLSEKPDLFQYKYYEPDEIKKEEFPILIDTREQKPFFEGEKSSMNVGDYCFAGEHYNGVNIDRKSKEDFISTFTNGLERFQRECEKAKALDIKLVVLVEESYQECWLFRPMRYQKQKVTGENAFAGLRSISREYDVQFVFAKNLEHAKKLVNTILSNKKLVEEWDLQFLIEKDII